jgi:hypothetical protein
MIGVKLDDVAPWWWHSELNNNDMIWNVHGSKELVAVCFLVWKFMSYFYIYNIFNDAVSGTDFIKLMMR